MTTPLSLVPQRRPDGTTVLAAGGEIDMSNAPALAAALEETTELLVLDLTDVEYLDSAGIAVLFDHADHLELVASPLLSPVLTVSGLSEVVKVHQPRQ
ncbi:MULTISPECIES: STAS domain-containing protein [unclassified Amycolatopsis]|uniref:STAS domain-containing protein n=1 Tax=unclassified Amycolatopsis TaxID=2618356 RepID=UPI001FF4982E|nr:MULTISPECIES: STAS domain-containing protein [unclassified Amycolatopsis]UOZ02982.1 STAS domain-containing protein [Amycolatopsis sp. WQ 127309]WSJ78453.1 STAS domain-containing protein [Amycolatopsis sp. NBC_01307]WSK77982.1 STAS domain-containing protein [Amycolatopsis sp. NBC_01286]